MDLQNTSSKLTNLLSSTLFKINKLQSKIVDLFNLSHRLKNNELQFMYFYYPLGLITTRFSIIYYLIFFMIHHMFSEMLSYL